MIKVKTIKCKRCGSKCFIVRTSTLGILADYYSVFFKCKKCGNEFKLSMSQKKFNKKVLKNGR